MADQNKTKKMRWRYFIDRPFQIRFIGKFVILILIGLIISLGFLFLQNQRRYNENLYFQIQDADDLEELQIRVTAEYGYQGMQVLAQAFDLTAPVNSFDIQKWPMINMTILFLLLIIVFGLFISHKMAGPIYRIKKTLKEVSDGTVDVKEVKFRLRKKDELKDLVDSLNEFIDNTVQKK